jgi:hypothetical protein
MKTMLNLAYGVSTGVALLVLMLHVMMKVMGNPSAFNYTFWIVFAVSSAVALGMKGIE